MIVLVNGSPGGRKATSHKILAAIAEQLDRKQVPYTTAGISIGKKGVNNPEVLARVAAARLIVFAFPLYAYSLPAPLILFLHQLQPYLENRDATQPPVRVHCFVNCGFYKPHINAEAIRSMRLFCRDTGLQFRSATQIGSGPVVVMMRKVPLVNTRLKRAFRRVMTDTRGLLAEQGMQGEHDVQGEHGEWKPILIRPLLPRRFMEFMKDSEWSKNYMKKQEEKRKHQQKTTPEGIESARR